MMLDTDVVTVTSSSIYRKFKVVGKLARCWGKPSKKGKGFEQPVRPHKRWHIDVSYINICRMFHLLCSILEGYSRFVIHWEIREIMRNVKSRQPFNGLGSSFPVSDPGLSQTTGHNSSPKTSRSFPHLWDDPRENLAVVSSKQRQDGVVVRDPERRVHPCQNALELERHLVVGYRVRRLL